MKGKYPDIQRVPASYVGCAMKDVTAARIPIVTQLTEELGNSLVATSELIDTLYARLHKYMPEVNPSMQEQLEAPSRDFEYAQTLQELIDRSNRHADDLRNLLSLLEI